MASLDSIGANYQVWVSQASTSKNEKKESSEMETLLGKEFKLREFTTPSSKCKIKKGKEHTYIIYGMKRYEILSGRILSDNGNIKIKCIMSGSNLYDGNGEKVASIQWDPSSSDSDCIYNRKNEKIGVFYMSWAPAGSCGSYSLKDINGRFSIVSSYGDFNDINFLVNDKEKIVYILPKDFNIEK